MISCHVCGKLIASGTGEIACRACRMAALNEAVESQEEVPVTEVDQQPEVYPPEKCVRCRRNEAMEDSEFCVGCQLELVSALGDAAEAIFRIPPQPLPSPVSLRSELEEKRERTGTRRLRVVGAAKIK